MHYRTEEVAPLETLRALDGAPLWARESNPSWVERRPLGEEAPLFEMPSGLSKTWAMLGAPRYIDSASADPVIIPMVVTGVQESEEQDDVVRSLAEFCFVLDTALAVIIVLVTAFG